MKKTLFGHRDQPHGGNGGRLLYRVDEAAEMLGVSKSTAYTLISRNQIPVVRLSGMLRVPAHALFRLIEENTTEPRRAEDDR